MIHITRDQWQALQLQARVRKSRLYISTIDLDHCFNGEIDLSNAVDAREPDAFRLKDIKGFPSSPSLRRTLDFHETASWVYVLNSRLVVTEGILRNAEAEVVKPLLILAAAS